MKREERGRKTEGSGCGDHDSGEGQGGRGGGGVKRRGRATISRWGGGGGLAGYFLFGEFNESLNQQECPELLGCSQTCAEVIVTVVVLVTEAHCAGLKLSDTATQP